MRMLPKERLKMAREKAGFHTPSAAARACKNINVNTLISNENGNRDISRTMAVRYAEAFGVKPGWILYGDEYQGSPLFGSEYQKFQDDNSTKVPITAYSNQARGLETNRIDVPLISWVSAGQPFFQEGITDFSDFPTIAAYDLPKGEWIALRVDGQSMNKISPHDSIILVNMADRELIANAYYIIMDETGQVTYKRFRPHEKPPFQPFSYQEIKPPALQGDIAIIGRVRRTITDM